MVEIRDISASDTPPDTVDYLLVERAGDKFVVNGAATSGPKSATFFRAAPYDTEKVAVAAAVAWAERNGVPVVYVRGAR